MAMLNNQRVVIGVNKKMYSERNKRELFDKKLPISTNGFLKLS